MRAARSLTTHNPYVSAGEARSNEYPLDIFVRRDLENIVDITANEYKKERDQLAEQVNQLSEVLLGYREGRHFDLITRANHLKLKSQNVEIANQYREIADAISELKQLSDDVMGDA